MKSLTIATALLIGMSVAIAQTNTIYRDQNGQVVGSSMNNNGAVTYRDQNGQVTGTALNNNSIVNYRNANGQSIGTAISTPNQFNNGQTPPPFYGQPQRQ